MSIMTGWRWKTVSTGLESPASGSILCVCECVYVCEYMSVCMCTYVSACVHT